MRRAIRDTVNETCLLSMLVAWIWHHLQQHCIQHLFGTKQKAHRGLVKPAMLCMADIFDDRIHLVCAVMMFDADPGSA